MAEVEIPITVDEGSIAETYLELVNNILRETGEINEDLASLSSPAIHTVLVKDYLNFTVQDIWNRARWKFAQAEKIYAPQADQELYSWPDDFSRTLSDPYYKGKQLKYISRDELNKSAPDRSSSGQPTHYGFFNESLFLYPIPSSGWISDDVVVGTDSKIYVCKLNHTSSTDDKPITGANYATYWEQDLDATTGGTWATGTAYEDKRIRFEYYREPVHMNNDGDYPDLPDRMVETLKVGARARFKQHLETQDAHADRMLYEQMLYRHVRRRLQGQGPFRIRPNR